MPRAELSNCRPQGRFTSLHRKATLLLRAFRAISQAPVRFTAALLISMLAIPAIAQKPPAASERPWYSAEEGQIANEAKRFLHPAFLPEPGKVWSLPELI